MTINLSDLAAMGATPRHALISLCLRRETLGVEVDRLYRGITEQARRFSCSIAGGDLSATDGPLMLSATLVGRVPSARSLLKRAGARPGWQIAVTGTVGGAAAGLRVLESRRLPRTATERRWVRQQLDPEPRIEAGQALVRAGVTVAGDISDGLYREVEKLAEAAGTGATLDVDLLPLARGLRRDEFRLGLAGSEDFELVCAAPPVRMQRAERELQETVSPLTVIGTIDAEPGIRVRAGATPAMFEEMGYQHFR